MEFMPSKESEYSSLSSSPTLSLMYTESTLTSLWDAVHLNMLSEPPLGLESWSITVGKCTFTCSVESSNPQLSKNWHKIRDANIREREREKRADEIKTHK
jgi:hypothetical protein